LFGAVASIGHMLLNKADRRSWLTLPGGVQLAQVKASAGSKTLQIGVGAMQVDVPVDVQGGKTTLVYVNYAAEKMSTASLTF